MPIANPTNVAANQMAAGATGVTASVTPTHNASDGCSILWVALQDTAASFATTISSVTGCGLTWTLLTGGTGTAAAHWGMWVFAGIGTPSAGAITITPDQSVNQYIFILDQIASGADVSSPGSWQVANANTGAGTALSLTPTVASAGANDMVMACAVHRVNEAQTYERTLILEYTSAAPAARMGSQYNAGNGDLGLQTSWATTQAAAACAVVVPAAAASGASTTQFLQLLGAGT